jgi:hypothetical protein
MHPTADTLDFIYSNRAGRRVMPGVRRLLDTEAASKILTKGVADVFPNPKPTMPKL